jgi:neutral amino acid transport system ATP-binding protein
VSEAARAATVEAPAPGAQGGGDGGDRILVVTDVHKRFGGIRAVQGATLDVKRGSVTALIGPNGAGKTTLFHLVTGFVRADRGDVRYDGASIVRQPSYRIARRGLVRTFQLTKTLAAMSVLDNIMLAAPDQPGERLSGLLLHPAAARRREREWRERAFALLDVFNLRAKAGDYAGTLSGGQRKLLELARALMLQPRLVLLDEPMAGVNPSLGRQLLDHMHTLRADLGVTFVFIEHDMEVVMGHADRVIVMAQGQVIADGSPAAVRSDERVIDAYLGEAAGGGA